MLLKVARYALMILLALLAGRVALAKSPAGVEQTFTLEHAANQFAVAAKEGCCKVWILIKGGDGATKLNSLYGPNLIPKDATLQEGSWWPVNFAKLNPQLQEAIRAKLGHASVQEIVPVGTPLPAAQPPAAQPPAAQPPAAQPPAAQPAATQRPVNLVLFILLSLLIGLLLLLTGVLLGALTGERLLLERLYREAHDHPSRTVIATQIDEVIELLQEKNSTSVAAQRLREYRTAWDLSASERTELAQPLFQVTRLNPATTNLLHMAQQIAEVVAKAGEQNSLSAKAQPWTIFTWRERWNALLEDQRSGELARAKEMLRRNFGDLDLVEFIGKIAGVLSVLQVGRSDTVSPKGVPAVSMALSELISVASLVTKELAVHSGLSAEESLDRHLRKIREILLGLSLQEYLRKMTGEREELELSVEEGAEVKLQLMELKGKVDNARTVLYGAGLGDGDLFKGLQEMVQERDQVRARLRELAGEDGSGSDMEIMARVKQQLTDARSEVQKGRSKLAGWSGWWRRLASTFGYRVVDREPDEPPPVIALQASGVWWNLRLGFLAMLGGWPAEIANVPPEAREHLRIDEVHRGARELVDLLEDLAGQEALGDEGDKMWDLLKAKAGAINGIVRAHEFLRTYYTNSAPTFRHRLTIGVSALDLAFAAARARLVKVELLSLVKVDTSLFDIEYIDESLRQLEGPSAKIPERLVRERGGGFPVDMIACAFERNGEVAARGRVVLVTPGTWNELLPRASSNA